jgi:putative radical SAM enzyme (TIGR03279 family)
MSNKKQFSSSAYVRKGNDQDFERQVIKAQHEYRDASAHRKSEQAQKLRVLGVDPGSLAERIGLQAGDEIHQLNGKPLLDAIDFQFEAATIGRRTTIRTHNRTITFVRREWESFGLEFEPIEPMTCANQCVFCFVHQVPKNVRRSLHIKDEDYRLSFLFGNYLTLTNVHDAELQRIIEQRLSPLYISVHATELELRARLLGNAEYDGLLEKIERLAAAGIMLHCQVVLCPGLNDGEHLERTIADLAKFHPAVASLAVVPLGLTKHRRNLPVLQPFTPEHARHTIAHITPFQRQFKKTLGTPFVFLGDEIYIMAEAELPPSNHYADFPQIENGVGMVRTFLRRFKRAARTHKFGPGVRGTICTGRIFHPYLKELVDQLGLDLRTVAVESRFWGEGIGVAGLLTGSDFIAALKDNVHGDFVVLPSESMIGDDYLFLDDLTIRDVERELGVEVIPSGYDAGDFVGLLAARSKNSPNLGGESATPVAEGVVRSNVRDSEPPQ